MTASLPLDGVRVLDLTSYVSGPHATQILAWLGAQVIKVERPGGEHGRAWGHDAGRGQSVIFDSVNSGKRSIILDLGTVQGTSVLNSLVRRVDVVVHNMRPDAASALGLEPSRLRDLNPGLISCNVAAFSSNSSAAGRPGYDPLVQALCGLMSLTGTPSSGPMRVGASIVDIGAGLWAAVSILAALFGRQKHPVGSEIEIALFDVGVDFVAYHGLEFLTSGRVAQPSGTAHPMIAPWEAFPTVDRSIMILAGSDDQFARLCVGLEARELLGDPRFRTNQLRVENRDALHDLLAAKTAARSSVDLEDSLQRVGVSAGPVLDVGEAFSSALATESGQIDIDERGRATVLPPVRIDGRRWSYASRPPTAGEHTIEVLAEAGFSRESVNEFIKAGVVGASTSQSHGQGDNHEP